MSTDTDSPKGQTRGPWQFVAYAALVALCLVIVWFGALITAVIWSWASWLFVAIWFNTLGLPFWCLSSETGASPFSPGALTVAFLLYLFFEVCSMHERVDFWSLYDLETDPHGADSQKANFKWLKWRLIRLGIVYVFLFVCSLCIWLA